MPSEGPGHFDGGRVRAAPALLVGLAGLALTLAALTFAAVPLLVPGIGFVALAAAALAWVALAARGITVERGVSTHRALEDEPFEATLTVRRGRLGAPGATVHDPLTGARIELGERLAPLTGTRELELRVAARFHRRGRHAFPAPSVQLSDALGLVRTIRRGSGPPDEVLVLPRTEPVHWLIREGGAAVSGHGSPANHEPMGAGEIDGLRDHTPGTPAARIHWPALARGAGLLERRLVDEPDAEPLIVLDARAPDTAEGRDRVDAAVRAAASLTLELARRGGASLLLPGARGPIAVGRDLAGWRAAHQRLAVVEAADERPRPPARAPGRGLGSVIWVAAGAGAITAPPVADAAGLVLVIPAALAERVAGTPSFRVAGCVGFVIRARRSRRRRPAVASSTIANSGGGER